MFNIFFSGWSLEKQIEKKEDKKLSKCFMYIVFGLLSTNNAQTIIKQRTITHMTINVKTSLT
ncbi:hypothetical protein ACFLTI_00480 [Bacteroidota bacterium]